MCVFAAVLDPSGYVSRGSPVEPTWKPFFIATRRMWTAMDCLSDLLNCSIFKLRERASHSIAVSRGISNPTSRALGGLKRAGSIDDMGDNFGATDMGSIYVSVFKFGHIWKAYIAIKLFEFTVIGVNIRRLPPPSFAYEASRNIEE